MPCGNVPPGAWNIGSNTSGAPRSTRRATIASNVGPAVPWPASTSIFSGLSAEISTHWQIRSTHTARASSKMAWTLPRVARFSNASDSASYLMRDKPLATSCGAELAHWNVVRRKEAECRQISKCADTFPAIGTNNVWSRNTSPRCRKARDQGHHILCQSDPVRRYSLAVQRTLRHHVPERPFWRQVPPQRLWRCGRRCFHPNRYRGGHECRRL